MNLSSDSLPSLPVSQGKISQEFYHPQYYSLTLNHPTSQGYYEEISQFTNHWIRQLHPILDETIKKIQDARASSGLKTRSFDEISLEYLALGVNLLEHGCQSEKTPYGLIHLHLNLIALQDKILFLQSFIKWVRSILVGISSSADKNKNPLRLTSSSVKKLVAWLAVSDLDAQARRLNDWIPYLNRLDDQSVQKFITGCLDLAARFKIESEICLGKYTQNLNENQRQRSIQARWRYDSALVSASSLEHHLGMLGTEILNRSFRANFKSAPSKMIILPPCLRAQPDHKCAANLSPGGAVCSACTPTCQINVISHKAAEKGMAVFIVADDELRKLCISSGQTGKGLGVIGAACVLRNWSAGWEADQLGLNAQGILLDYPGCQKHWFSNGIVTHINIDRLFALI